MKNKLIAMKEEHKKILGTMMSVSNQSSLECIGLSGLDFVIIDLEHGLYEYKEMLDLIRAAEIRGLVPLVRAKDPSRASILKTADAGARGIVAPMIKTIDQVKQMVTYGKYIPIGERGMCPNRCADFGERSTIKGRPITEYFAEANEETLILPQCETKEFIENAEEIMAMEGVDGTLIGPNDLSISLGIPGNLFCDEMERALKRILSACKKNNKFCIMTALSIDHAKKCYQDGFDAVLLGLDSLLLIQWYRDMVIQAKA